MAGAGFQGLFKGVAAEAVGIGPRREDGSEGILAAVVCTTGTGKAVGRGTDEAVDDPRITPRCRRGYAGLEATVLDDRSGGAGSDGEGKIPESAKHQHRTHLGCTKNVQLWKVDALN